MLNLFHLAVSAFQHNTQLFVVLKQVQDDEIWGLSQPFDHRPYRSGAADFCAADEEQIDIAPVGSPAFALSHWLSLA